MRFLHEPTVIRDHVEIVREVCVVGELLKLIKGRPIGVEQHAFVDLHPVGLVTLGVLGHFGLGCGGGLRVLEGVFLGLFGVLKETGKERVVVVLKELGVPLVVLFDKFSALSRDHFDRFYLIAAHTILGKPVLSVEYAPDGALLLSVKAYRG